MGAAVPFIPLIGAALPFILPLIGFGPKAPKAPKAPTAASGQVHRAAEVPKAPTLADANIERARRQARPGSIRSETLRTKPQGLLDDDLSTTTTSLL